MASLLCVTGINHGNYYPLGTRTMVVGRDEGCPIQVVDELVSRKHLQVRLDDTSSQYIMLDMKSANGTRVNGRDITGEIPLEDGDEIEIGKSKLVFSTQEFPDRESALNAWKERGQRRQMTIEQPK